MQTGKSQKVFEYTDQGVDFISDTRTSGNIRSRISLAPDKYQGSRRSVGSGIFSIFLPERVVIFLSFVYSLGCKITVFIWNAGKNEEKKRTFAP